MRSVGIFIAGRCRGKENRLENQDIEVKKT